MRTLTFEQISDTRFSGSKVKLNNIRNKIIKALNTLDGLIFQIEPPRKLEMNGEASFRQRYFVQKSGRKTTWNDVYRAINSVKPVPYDFVKRNPLD
ncbi:hypothetical protein [Aliivibrio fischeri]|uniref:hypothetical protein n=1 Tax=Aliivibrio fischeri TaxID=668 RepID=UPI0007C45882|nr:hypothetical protein [Aliivibrio fischeri]